MQDSVHGRMIETAMGDDGVVRIIVTSGERIEEGDAVHLLDSIERVSLARPVPVFVDLRKIRDISLGTRKVMSSPRAGELIVAAAVVVASSLSRMIGRFFLQLSRPPFEMQLFDDDDEALSWARGFLATGDDD